MNASCVSCGYRFGGVAIKSNMITCPECGEENRFEFHYLSLKGKAVADDPELGAHTFNYKVSVARDSLIMVSISKLGIEALRMLARNDSVFVRLSLEHRAIVSDFTMLSELSGFCRQEQI